MIFNDSNQLRSTELVLVISDFAGYTRAFAKRDDPAMAGFVNQFYDLAVETITGHGGRVVKFMGDACLAVFSGDAGSAAVRAVLELRRLAAPLIAAYDIDVALGARVHCGIVVEGHYGSSGHTQYDVIGAAVNATALMGGGPDVWISQGVYDQLDVEDRDHWERSDQVLRHR